MISLLLPTRKRPAAVNRLIRSIQDTAITMPEIVLYLDDDDYTILPDALKVTKLQIYVHTGPRILLSECWNTCMKHATGDILMHCGDDIIFRTKGWDKMVEDQFKDRPFQFIHGDDGYFGDRFGTHGFLHRKWVETVGYFVPPYFSCDYNDTWLNDVANQLGVRKYLPFVTEHMHPNFGKGPLDQTHLERIARGATDNVTKLYDELASARMADVEKLKAAMQSYELSCHN